jgi:hypothetical protein
MNLLKFIIFSTVIAFQLNASELESCNLKHNRLWIQTVHLAIEENEPSFRVPYPATQLWTPALPELGKVSIWLPKIDAADVSLELEFYKDGSQSVLSKSVVKLVLSEDIQWNALDGHYPYQSGVDLQGIMSEFVGQVEQGVVVFTLKADGQTLCGHKLMVNTLTDDH